MRFYFCFADLSPEYPPLISIYWFSCSTESPLCALSKLDSSTSEKCKGSSVKNIAHFKQESLATGRTTLRVKFQVGDSLKPACSLITRTSSYKLVFFSLCSRLGKQWYYYYFHYYYYYYYYYYCHHYYYYFSLKGIVYFIMIKPLFKGWVSLGQPTRPRV